MQNFIVTLIILTALGFVARRLFKALQTGSPSCGCCTGCSKTGCFSRQPDPQPGDVNPKSDNEDGYTDQPRRRSSR